MTGRLRRRDWIAGLALAGAIHFGVAYWLHAATMTNGAEAPGVGGIEVALGPAGGGPTTIAEEVTELAAVEAVAAEEHAPVEPDPPVTADVVPDEVVPVEMEAVEAVEPPITAEVVPEEIVPVELEVVEAIEPEPPVEAVEPPPEQVTMAEPQPVPPPPQRKPPIERPTASVETAMAAPPPAAVPDARPPAPAAPPAERAGPPAQEPVNGDATAGGGSPGLNPDYLAVLGAWLEKHKEYPRQAQMRRQEGTVLVRFVMDRQGRLLSYEIEQGSGYAALDREAEAMLRRASPLPNPPADMAQSQLELVVPVTFFLR